MAADLHPHWTDAPTVALRVPEQQGPPAQKSRAPLVVVLATAVMIAAILIVAIVMQAPTSAPVPVAPVPVPAAAPAAAMTQSERMDATLAGIDSGLELRKTWGANLTRQTATSTCNARAALAYPSTPDAVLVFAESCENVAVPR